MMSTNIEMIVKLKAIKPIREANQKLLNNAPIEIQLTALNSQKA